MSCGVTCRINSGWKMLSVQQCVRNTLNKNKEILICRGIGTFKKVSKSVSLVKFSQHAIRDRTICKVQWQSHISNAQRLVPSLGCHSFSNMPKEVEKKDDKSKEGTEEKLSTYQKLKKMYKEYWYVLVPVHLLTSSVWFGGFYYVAASGIDIPALLESLGAPESWIASLRNSKAGNLVLAYTLYKVATPLRYTVTVGGTTVSINYLKKWGWIKPVPNKEQFKKLYKEQKDALKDLKASYHDKMQVTKHEFMKTKNEIKLQYKEAKEGFHKTMQETRDDFKAGVKDGADEWREIGGALSKSIKEGLRNVHPGKK